MTHDKVHCTGEIGSYTCSIRGKCARYHLHLDAQKRGMTHVPYFTHIADLGYGKTFIHDISNGCCEYISTEHDDENDKSNNVVNIKKRTAMKTIQIEIPEGKEAKWVDGVLILVDEQPQDITERIKTFEDACKWCNNKDKEELVFVYNIISEPFGKNSDTRDLLAYLKLRIITCALNEGWEPTFEEGEERYSVICNDSDGEGGLIFYCSYGGFSYAEAAKLLFKNQALTEYAATQFKDIYMEFCNKGKE